MAKHPIIFAIIMYVFLLSIMSETHASITKTGFTANLIHIDSPNSPFYNASQTNYDRLHNSFIRSVNRPYRCMRGPKNKLQSIASESLFHGAGEYYIDVNIGTPPVRTKLIVDTGSDLIWTQCQPCTNCYTQNDPIFNPKLSTTFNQMPCDSDPCRSIGNGRFSCSTDKLCAYDYPYVGSAYTKGVLSSDAMSVGSLSLPNAVFGCGYDNVHFGVPGSGILGLGRSPISFLSQLNIRQFSYCLVDTFDSVSKLYFGSDAVVSGDGAISTPMVLYDTNHYYLILEGINVGTNEISSGGAMMSIDSGTTSTYLPAKLYGAFASAMDGAIIASGVQRAVDPYGFLKLCYQSAGNLTPLPQVTFRFSNSGNVAMVNTVVRMSREVVCLAIMPTDGVATLGSLAQLGYMVGYDLDKKVVSFKPTDCNAT